MSRLLGHCMASDDDIEEVPAKPMTIMEPRHPFDTSENEKIEKGKFITEKEKKNE